MCFSVLASPHPLPEFSLLELIDSLQESKRVFLHNIVSEGLGDISKLCSFVNFCEDTIFEVRHVL